MPIFHWLTVPSTSGSAAANVYQTITQAQQDLLSQTSSTNSAGAWAVLCNQQNVATATAGNWHGLGTTTTTSTGTTYWTFDTTHDRWFTQEEMVDHSQYVALAQRRVEYTEEQLAAIARAQEERQRQAAEEQARWEREHAAHEEQRKAAYLKSRELLLKHLTPAQCRTFEQNAWFVVQGGKTKKTYRIRTTGYTGNIEELRGERVTHTLCGHLRGAYALHDHHVAQKISLEYDEEAFVRLCNRHAA